MELAPDLSLDDLRRAMVAIKALRVDMDADVWTWKINPAWYRAYRLIAAKWESKEKYRMERIARKGATAP